MDDLRNKVESIVREVVMEWAAGGGVREAAAAENPRSRPLVAANWKMNHLSKDARAFAERLEPTSDAEILICPPAILIPVLRDALAGRPQIALGAQDLHTEPKGAFTGEHSAAMIRDAGASHVIVGHSERRWIFGETDEVVSNKVEAAVEGGLVPIICVGERLEERESGATFRVLRTQLAAALAGIGIPAPGPSEIIIAYEPVWAIGTGRTASPEQASEAIAFVRDVLAERFGWEHAKKVRLLYGGSVSPKNAGDLARKQEIDGFLVGGASLSADQLGSIARSAASGSTRERGKEQVR